MSLEFSTIRDLFAPLAHPQWARGLKDDVAALPSRPGYDLILTKDAIVEGVHFLPDDPLDTVAQKLIRVNLSDLAAKGAESFGYMLACAWSSRCGWSERERFAAGLAVDQQAFGVSLLGGDTVSTPGPATFALTMLGWAARGETVGRDGARPGDKVFVSGRIGDGRLGLAAAQGRLRAAPERLESLIEHYRRPSPQLALAPVIREFATASLDVSDGLVADLGHIAVASGVGLVLALETLPLSAAGQAWVEARADHQDALLSLATGGDDYEIAFTVRAEDEDRVRRRAEGLHVRVTCIGEATAAGPGAVQVRYLGLDTPAGQGGWTHG
ncbi:thiamine-phosphate kinase [Brevundimonas sp. VNH65]|uniref:thiamine-phosphate kinase n=1 Tax=Brevundimonas sp. VNH65 TaxID=3400917 RepID=UPI003C0DF21F